MAEINDNVLGNYSGSLGNITLRNIGGKTFSSSRPKHYKPTKSEKAVKLRNTFREICKFAVYVNKIPEIKTVWKNSVLKGQRGYNQIISVNQKISQNG